MNEIAERVEKRVGIVVRQIAARRQSFGAGAVEGGRINQRAGGVGRAVNPVGASVKSAASRVVTVR